MNYSNVAGTGITVAAVALMASSIYFSSKLPMPVGKFSVGTNRIEVVKYNGLVGNWYGFFQGTNSLGMVDSWDGTAGRFELDGKVVSFDKWNGPYQISEKPKIETVKLQR